MKKTALMLLLATLLFSLSTKSASALDIVIQPNHTTNFYEPRVLGENSGSGKNESHSGSENESESGKSGSSGGSSETQSAPATQPQSAPAAVAAPTVSTSNQQSPEQPRSSSGSSESRGGTFAKPSTVFRKSTAVPPKLVKTIKNENSQLRLKSGATGTEVQIEKKPFEVESNDSKVGVPKKPEFETKEVLKTDRINLEVPAGDGQTKPVEDQKKSADDQSTQRTPEAEAVLQERRSRVQEKMEVKSEQQNGATEFQFESRNVKAKLQGAEVVIDPATNEVSITTPNGEQHTLIHLPDQALEKIKNSGIVASASGSFNNEVEIKTNEDGTVSYQIPVQKQKKLFGLFTRTVDATVQLNDQTGEVTETEKPANDPFSRLLNFFSR